MRIFPKSEGKVSILELDIPSTARMNPSPNWGTLHAAFKRTGPMSVGISTGGVASMALFDALVATSNLPISVSYKFANSQEMVERIRSGSLADTVDAVNLSIVCAMRLMGDPGRSDFRPFMLMPHNSHAVLRCRNPGAAENPFSGSKRREKSAVPPNAVHLLYSERSSAALYAPSLIGAAGGRATQMVLEEPLALRSALSEGAARVTPLWWPHYETFSLSTDVVTEKLTSIWEFDVTVLFLHRRFADDRALSTNLVLALRDTWLRLLEKPKRLEAVVNRRYEDEDFYRFFSRSIGEFECPTPRQAVGE
jgi:hypothetical protein